MANDNFFISNAERIGLLKTLLLEPDLLYNDLSRRRVSFILDSLTSDFVTDLNPLERRRIQQDLQRIESLFEDYKNNSENFNQKDDMLSVINILYHRCRRYNQRRASEYNSEKYYKDLISELQEKESRLKKELSESQQTSEEIEELKKELEITKDQKEQYETEKEELKRRLDAQDNINKKITKTFDDLKTHISSLEAEKVRLNGMFYVYAVLCVGVLGLLVYFEFNYLSRWKSISTELNWIDYLPFYIPVPIVGGLLWVFIYQMNRAQRQLMHVANELYHVDYVEGLLQAINSVSPNVTSASEKISHVLDILIQKHISIPEGLFEKSLETEISKDSINIDTFLDLAKKVKDVIK